MAAITATEVRPGLVVFLDTTELRAHGGCETNAMREPEDRAVTGPHLFLILKLNAKSARCLAVPLYSGSAADRDELVATKKQGTLREWADEESYACWYQHWWIPVSAVVLASAGEKTLPDDRCTYAIGDQAELARLARRIELNRYSFVPL